MRGLCPQPQTGLRTVATQLQAETVAQGLLLASGNRWYLGALGHFRVCLQTVTKSALMSFFGAPGSTQAVPLGCGVTFLLGQPRQAALYLRPTLNLKSQGPPTPKRPSLC